MPALYRRPSRFETFRIPSSKPSASARAGRSVQRELLAIEGTAVLDRGSLAKRLDAFRRSAGTSLNVDEVHEAIEEGRT